MLLLPSTTDKLQLTTSAAVTVDVHASFVDMTTADPPVVKGSTTSKQNTAISTATTTDIVAAPAASTIRNVKTVNIRNKHASASVDVTAIYDANGTDYELFKATLRAGEVLEYVEGVGWFVVYAATSPQLRTVKLGSDQSNATTTATEVTGMSLTTGTGTFNFQYKLITVTSATGTTPKFAINHTGTLTAINYFVYTTSANALAADGVVDGDISLTTGGLFNVNAARAKSTTALTAFVSHDTTTDVMYIIDGIMVCTVDGDIELWHGSETAASTTVKAGSSLVLIRTDP